MTIRWRALLTALALLALAADAVNAQGEPVADSAATSARAGSALPFVGAFVGSATGLYLAAHGAGAEGGRLAVAIGLSTSSLSALGAWAFSPAEVRPSATDLFVGASVGAAVGALAAMGAVWATNVIEDGSGWGSVAITYAVTQAAFTALIGGKPRTARRRRPSSFVERSGGTIHCCDQSNYLWSGPTPLRWCCEGGLP